MKITRHIESNLDSIQSAMTFVVDDETGWVDITIVDKAYVYASARMRKQEFLDLVVACWPENVAYQFRGEE